MAKVLVLEVQFLKRVCFLGGQFFCKTRIWVWVRFLDDTKNLYPVIFLILPPTQIYSVLKQDYAYFGELSNQINHVPDLSVY